jgi:uncharacterized membrane protein
METWMLLAAALVLAWVLGVVGFFRARQAMVELRRLEAVLAELRGRLEAGGVIEAASPAAPPAAPPAEAPVEAAQPEPATEPAPAATPAPVATPAPEAAPGRSLEELLTLRWSTWAGAAALLLAGVFLIRYAVENAVFGPGARCAGAALLGLALVAGAEWLARRPTRAPRLPLGDDAPSALAAGGVAILLGAAYGAGPFFGLVPPPFDMVLMAAAGLAGLALSLRHGRLVAAVGLAGAFATPALVATEEPFLPGLFAYLLVLVAAAAGVVRLTAWGWLGWSAIGAGAAWAVVGGAIAAGQGEAPWAPALFLPAAAALQLGLLPAGALGTRLGRALAWAGFGALGGAALVLVAGHEGWAPMAALLLLLAVAIWRGLAEPRLGLLPGLASLLGLLGLVAIDLPGWSPTWEDVVVEGQVQARFPGALVPEALEPFLIQAALLAALAALAGLWGERRAVPRPSAWAALPAAVPLLALGIAYARVRGFATDPSWAALALALAAALVGAAAASMRAGRTGAAGALAAGATGAVALGCGMVLRDQWLSFAIALTLPALAWIEARTGLAALRRVAVVAAALLAVRLLLNPEMLDYALGITPVLNALWISHAAPAAACALAAAIFRRRREDADVARLEGAAALFATAFVVLQVSHASREGALSGLPPDFMEFAFQAAALALLSMVTHWLDRRRGRVPGALALTWHLQGLAALGLGLLLLLPPSNPLETKSWLGNWPVLNALLPAYLIPGLVALRACTWPETAAKEGQAPVLRRLLGTYGLLACLAWATLVVRHAFHPAPGDFVFAEVGEAELWSYSGAWVAFAAALLLGGILTGQRALRLAALGMTTLVTLKVFFVDMSELVGLWRVLSFLGLGLALIGLGAVYRRFVLGGSVTPPAAGAAPTG